MLNKPVVATIRTDEDDPRLGHLIRAQTSDQDCRVVILGFPSDEGVRRNSGRPGAAIAPDSIRAQLYSLTPDSRCFDRFSAVARSCLDLGNLQVTGDLESDQENLATVLAPWIKKGALAILLGGGHALAYAHFLGYVRAGVGVDILNWDAHADVRPLMNGLGHSGSPFRQAILHPSGRCRSYTACGLLPFRVAKAHIDFIRETGNRLCWRDEITEQSIRGIYGHSRSENMIVSFDIDAVEITSAPGVSAPSVGGLPAGLWLQAAYEAGRHQKVRSMDLCELNPRWDVDDRTARLAALTVWQFLRGVAERE